MMRFYFDFDDGLHQMLDDVGLEMRDERAARDAAIGALPGVAEEHLPDGDTHEFKVNVREGGAVIFAAKLALTSQWVGSRGSRRHIDDAL